MTTRDLYEKLCEFNEDEKFYANYYDARQKKWKLDEFLAHLDVKEVLERKLIITEVNTGYMPSAMSDDTYFETEDQNSIVLSKHNRYTPAFRHRHVFFEIAYVLSGSCVQKINQDEITVTEGQFCLLAPNVPHSISVFDSSLVINLLIRRSTFENIFSALTHADNKISRFFNQSLYATTGNDYLVLDTNKDPALREQVLAMFLEYVGKQKYYGEILNSQLIILFAAILRQYEDRIRYPAGSHKRNETFIELIDYIEKHMEDITLSELAAHFHYSQGYCSRLIKACTGKSFTQIVQDSRLQYACHLLKTTPVRISEIAHMAGFENVEHFNRLFKKRYQVTPGKFREEIHNE